MKPVMLGDVHTIVLPWTIRLSAHLLEKHSHRRNGNHCAVVQGMKPLREAGWPGMAADSGGLGSHDFTCEVSNTYSLVGH